jgi:hypothetical protein
MVWISAMVGCAMTIGTGIGEPRAQETVITPGSGRVAWVKVDETGMTFQLEREVVTPDNPKPSPELDPTIYFISSDKKFDEIRTVVYLNSHSRTPIELTTGGVDSLGRTTVRSVTFGLSLMRQEMEQQKQMAPKPKRSP